MIHCIAASPLGLQIVVHGTAREDRQKYTLSLLMAGYIRLPALSPVDFYDM
jgi:hypothetical protein